MSQPDDYQPRLWKCDCGLVLGYVYRDSSRIRHLAVFSQACLDFLISFDGPTVFAPIAVVVTGLDVGDVQCSCGRKKHWEIGNDALQELIDRKARRMFGLPRGG